MSPEDFIRALRETDFYIQMIYLHGGCYSFSKFLKSVYPEAQPYINASKDHVVTIINGVFYDIRGIVYGDFVPLSKQDAELCEKWSFSRNNWLYRRCPNCDEEIPA